MIASWSARIILALASVARIVLRTCICHSHDNTGIIASAVSTAIVNACDLVTIATHSFWARWTTVVTDIFACTSHTPARLTFEIVWTAITYVSLPKDRSIRGCSTVATLARANTATTLLSIVMSCRSFVDRVHGATDSTE